MIKEIPKPDWFGSGGTITVSCTEHWFDQTIEPLNKAIREGVEVYGDEHKYGLTFHSGLEDGVYDLKAYLIGIEPIKKETASDVLRDVIRLLDHDYHKEEIDRAKAALANEGE